MNIHDLVKEAERELRMRENVYPKWVDAGRMPAKTAERQMAAQQHILGCLNLVKSMLTEPDREKRKEYYKGIARAYTPKPPAQEQQSLFEEPKPSAYSE